MLKLWPYFTECLPRWVQSREVSLILLQLAVQKDVKYNTPTWLSKKVVGLLLVFGKGIIVMRRISVVRNTLNSSTSLIPGTDPPHHERRRTPLCFQVRPHIWNPFLAVEGFFRVRWQGWLWLVFKSRKDFGWLYLLVAKQQASPKSFSVFVLWS